LTGKQKEAERKRLQNLLREAFSKHTVECNVPYIQDLIEQAKIIKGSVLMLDVLQAENYMARHHNVVRETISVQAKYVKDQLIFFVNLY
jgi:hypothetical protein